MASKIDRLLDQFQLRCLEGPTAVKKLCGVVREAGDYRDPVGFGQHEYGCYGDLISFLEDNPGAIDDILNHLRTYFEEEEEEEEDF